MQDSDIQELIDSHDNYSVKWRSHTTSPSILLFFGSLLDRGINVDKRTGRKESVTGIDDHELPGLDIVTCVALIQTNHGKVNLLPSILLVKLNGSKMNVMTNPIMWEELFGWVCYTTGM